ncbi:hypothetical protein WOLCODRAFT_77377, partial [Wolfiporia cocos MD-104 SS10]
RRANIFSATQQRMPSNRRAPRRGTSDAFRLPRAIVDDIGNADSWNATVELLCNYFELPDISQRSGLKKVHLRFDEIFKKLDAAYTQNKENERIIGGIVGIWAKMSADALLRNKLFKAGLLAKMTPLLDIPATRHVGLQALATVTHHGGAEARKEIARLTPKLLRLMEECSDDDKVMELATVVMSHSISAVVGQDEPPDRKLLTVLDMRNTLKVTTDNLRKPSASALMVSHALGLLASATQHCYKECKAMPQLINLLVACLRSSDLTIRCNAMGGLIRLNAIEAEPDRQVWDPRKIFAVGQRKFPDPVVDTLMDYGMMRCDTMQTVRSAGDFQKAMMQCAQDHDLYKLGHKLAELILRTEFSIAEGCFQAINERTGRMESQDVGLPFVMWIDSLPHAARALRTKGSPADLDAADILDVKYFIIKQRYPDVIRVGQEALNRNPQLGYAYYAIALGGDSEQGLRSVKKGLKCKQVTPFVRYHMLWRAVEHAGNLGFTRLQEARVGDKDYTEGLAFLMSSYEDSKRFISEAPPDSRNMQTVANWYIVCSLAIRGPELSTDLKELNRTMHRNDLKIIIQDAFEKIKFTDQYNEFLDNRVFKTQMRLTRQIIVDAYPKAVKSWADVITRFDTMDLTSHHPLPSAAKVEDDLAAWLEHLTVDDGSEQRPQRCSHPTVNPNTVSLYRCSHCGNPSAALRKCGGCGKTR